MDNQLTLTKLVCVSDLAITLKSGSLNVFATPAMIALMEETCATLLQMQLQDDMTSVGVQIDVKHLRATPLNMGVSCTAIYLGIDGKRHHFNIECFDEIEKIGEAQHWRVVVDGSSFQERADQKLQ